jgi:autotransporter-associated beta strand protein
LIFLFLILTSFGQNFSPKGITAQWDAGSGGGIQEGAGNWDSTSANWNYNNGSTRSPFCQGCNVQIGKAGAVGTAGTITVTGTQNFESIFFDAITSGGGASYTISGGNLNCSTHLSSCTYTVNKDSTINSVIQGSKGLLKTGANLLTLGGANTYSGGTTISQGSIYSSSSTSMGTGLISINDSNTGTNNTTMEWGNGGTVSNNITVNNLGTGTVTIGSYKSPYVTFTGNMIFNKSVTINDSTGDRTTFTGPISGNVGNLTIAGGRTTMSGANTFVGNISILDGATLQPSSSAVPSNTTNVNINGTGAFRITGGGTVAINSLTGSGSVNINTPSNMTLSLGNNNNGGTYSGIISNGTNVLSLIKNGTGLTTLSGANTYTGGNTVNGGTLVCNHATGFGSGPLTIATNANVIKKKGCSVSSVTCNGTCNLLDNVASGAMGAYSLRRLSRAYTGHAIRVWRDDAQNRYIDFLANGDLDTATLLSFAGTHSVGVWEWEDQSGNGYNAIQSTAANMPQIVNAGQIETSGRNGIPSINFMGTRWLDTQKGIQTMTNAGAEGSLLMAVKLVWNGNTDSFGAFGSGTDRWSVHFPWSNNVTYFDPPMDGARVSVGTSAKNNLWGQFSFIRDTTTSSIRWDGVQRAQTTGIASTTKATTDNNFLIGYATGGPDNGFAGSLTEFLIFKKGISGNDLSLIEGDQMAYWTSPLGSLSVTPTGAYSLRRLSYAYTGPAIRVRKSSNNAEQDIGFLPNGDLDVASLTTFVGIDSGYVSRWFDQSGNNRHAKQLVWIKQPRIVNAGILETSSKTGMPSLNFTGDGTLSLDTGEDTQNMTKAGADGSLFMIAFSISEQASAFGAYESPSNRWHAHMVWVNGNIYFDAGGDGCCRTAGAYGDVANNWKRLNLIRGSTYGAIRWDGIEKIRNNSIASTSHTTTTRTFWIGACNNSSNIGWTGKFSEFIMFNSGISGNDLTALEQSQKDYWGVP